MKNLGFLSLCSSFSKPATMLAALALLVVFTPRSAQAAGVEDTVSGSIALGRAANYVREADFLATWQNPANLAVVPGADVGLELRLPLLKACFDRARDPGRQYKQP